MDIKKQNVLFTVISAILSLMCSLAFTRRWLDVISRGIFIITLAVFNIVVRLIQFFMNRKEQTKLSEELENYVFAIFFADVVGDRDRAISAIEHGQQSANDLSTVQAQVSIVFFVGLSTFSDCTFDMFQGIILLNGIEYDNEVELFLLIGTWIGFGEQIFDFFEDMVSLTTDSLKEGGIVTYLVSFILYINILAEQSLGIYIASYGLTEHGQLLIVTIGIHLSLIIILFCSPFFIYGLKDVGFDIIAGAFSVVNAYIFTFRIISQTKIRAVFVMTMASINIFFRTIQICRITKNAEGYKWYLLLANLSLFSDCAFDMIQAVILFCSVTYSDSIHLFLIIGTGLGSFQQILIILGECITACVQREHCEGMCCFGLRLVLDCLAYMVAFASQSIGIYIITKGLSFDAYQILLIISYSITGIVMLLICCSSCLCCCLILLRQVDDGQKDDIGGGEQRAENYSGNAETQNYGGDNYRDDDYGGDGYGGDDYGGNEETINYYSDEDDEL